MTRASDQPRHKDSILPLVVGAVCIVAGLGLVIAAVLS